MREHCAARDGDTPDELWWLEHEPVYTLGKAGRPEHVVGDTGGTPVLRSDRGGQITWHGPGQLVVYTLLDLQRVGMTVRDAVSLLEDAVVAALAEAGIRGQSRRDAPGVYVDGAKVAAVGLRVSRGCCYHGLALNVDCDLAAFAAIDPCGYKGMPVTRTADLGNADGVEAWAERIVARLQQGLPAAKR